MSTLFDPLHTASVALDLVAAQHAPPSLLKARQEQRLRALWAKACAGSAFYRERLRGLEPGLAGLSAVAPVRRQELMARFDDWVCDPALRLSELRAFIADPSRIGEPWLGRYLVWESSGTSHAPGIFIQDAATLAVYDALEALRRAVPPTWQRCWNPWQVGERMAFVGVTTGHFASVISAQRLRRLNPLLGQSLRCFSILQSTEALVDELNAFGPHLIATYPSVGALLAHETLQGRLTARPAEVWTGGETLTPAVRRRIESTWGCVLRNSYGASEFMSMAWECRLGRLHANADWVLLEAVDEHGRPVPAGEPSHTTLLTHLANTVQPLIRYDLGDQITWSGQPCPCGCSLPVLEVQGRHDEPLQMVGLDGQTVTLLPLALSTVLEEEAGVFDFQFGQRGAQTLVLRLGSEVGADAGPRCRSVLERWARAQGLHDVVLDIEQAQGLPRGRSGKAQRRMRAEEGGGHRTHKPSK